MGLRCQHVREIAGNEGVGGSPVGRLSNVFERCPIEKGPGGGYAPRVVSPDSILGKGLVPCCANGRDKPAGYRIPRNRTVGRPGRDEQFRPAADVFGAVQVPF